MTDERTKAEEHLRVIRRLMERATVYRAISAPTALVGGLSALAISGWMLSRTGYFGANSGRAVPLTARDFILPWLAALAVTAAANAFFIWREAESHGRAFFSPGLRLALRSIIPNFVVAAAITLVAWRSPLDADAPVVLGLSWIVFYGLGLLATMSFAPRSLCLLGGAFVFVALLWLLLVSSPLLPDAEELRGYTGASFAMALTFGVFHLIYAGGSWPRRGSHLRAPTE